MTTSICWFRNDLRLRDQTALKAAAQGADRLVCLYIWDPKADGDWAPGPVQRAWLAASLEALRDALEEKGQKLILRSGATAKVLKEIAEAVGAQKIYVQHRIEPAAVELEAQVAKALKAAGIELVVTPGDLLFPPDEVQSKKGGKIKVFTPFWKACCALSQPAKPTMTPQLPPPAKCASEKLSDLELIDDPQMAKTLRQHWPAGEAGAQKRWKWFLAGPIDHYEKGRDLPGEDGTSKISPWLHFGEISPRQMWHDIRSQGHLTKGAETYLRELGWREFSQHMLVHFPFTPDDPLRPEFAHFPWRRNQKWLELWKEGMTGYPLVDAGMRQLLETGWMHNRVRMNVASFLVKHLRLPWQWGERWFWERLVDADLGNNTMGWQWSAGCGADAAPYFRIFNPILQGLKFDPKGEYVRQWVPELADLPDEWIHRPWEAPEEVLRAAGVTLGKDYPRPVVEHEKARDEALEAFSSLRGGA
jgi:deoxyribodipyrimidine photo-lyase